MENYEEKYNRALEQARTYYNGGNEFLDTIFPELKESAVVNLSKASPLGHALRAERRKLRVRHQTNNLLMQEEIINEIFITTK